MNIKINKLQRLFVIPCGGGFSCLGFDVERAKTRAILAELKQPGPVARPGTRAAYAEYLAALETAKQSGRRLVCDLHPRLIGLEGRRIECTLYGEKVRFKVGKSTGFIPCHLALHNARSTGGEAISAGENLGSIKIIK